MRYRQERGMKLGTKRERELYWTSECRNSTSECIRTLGIFLFAFFWKGNNFFSGLLEWGWTLILFPENSKQCMQKIFYLKINEFTLTWTLTWINFNSLRLLAFELVTWGMMKLQAIKTICNAITLPGIN